MEYRVHIRRYFEQAAKPSGYRAHWFGLLIISAALFFLVIVWGGYALWRAYSGEFLSTDAEFIGRETISREEMQRVLSVYEERALRYQQILNSPSAPADPSR